jgi:hypothetical protein
MGKLTIAFVAASAILVAAATVIIACRDRHRGDGHADDRSVASSTEEAASTSCDGPGSAASGELATVRAEVLSLRRDVEALRAELARLAERGATTDKGNERPHSQPAENKEETKNSMMDRLAKVQESFVREPADANWSSARTTSIRELTDKSESLRHAVRSVECRSRTCRVELTDDPAANLGENLSVFTSGLAATLPNVTTDWVRAPDGTGTYVLYMSGS